MVAVAAEVASEEVGEDFAHHGEVDIADDEIGGTGADGVGRTLPGRSMFAGERDRGRFDITGPDGGRTQR